MEDIPKENIYLWAFNVLRYDKLRKIPGCSGLVDIFAVTLDTAFIKQIAAVLNLPEENVFIDSQITKETADQRYKYFANKSAELKKQGTPHLYIVYCGGHGVSKDEKQIFLFNTEDKSKVFFNIELKFRTISDNYDARVCCIYDVCRVAVEGQFTQEKKVTSGENAG